MRMRPIALQNIAGAKGGAYARTGNVGRRTLSTDHRISTLNRPRENRNWRAKRLILFSAGQKS
jgi:hypothetical protein